MSRLLLRNLRLLDRSAPAAIAVEGDRILWVGPDPDATSYDAADEVFDAEGASVTSAFVDAHLHLVQTGMSLGQLDLASATSSADVLDRVSQAADTTTGLIEGWGWDDSTWQDSTPLTAQSLHNAAPRQSVYLARVDGHSAVVSSDLLALAQGYDGHSETGRVERDAHHVIRQELATRTTDADRLTAARRACAHLAAHGIVGFHENAAPHIGPVHEIDLVHSAADEFGLRATVYWGEVGATEVAAHHRVSGLAGDLNADGALGSRTAALLSEYADQPGHRGHLYLSERQIADHIVACTEAGLQAGFHCIGDAALAAVADGFRLASDRVGPDVLGAARHRLEHVEMPSPSHLDAFAAYGVAMSVQPAFDAHWGGPDRMYAQRVGPRWEQMNPLAAMVERGLTVAFGSDSPVTPIAPWEGVFAAMQHRTRDQRLSLAQALRCHTRAGWAAAGDDDSGLIRAGWRADLAVWETDTTTDGDPVIGPEHPTPRLKRTISAGQTIWRES